MSELYCSIPHSPNPNYIYLVFSHNRTKCECVLFQIWKIVLIYLKTSLSVHLSIQFFFTFSLDFQKRSKSKFPHFIFYFTSAVMKKMLLRTIGEKKLSWKWQKFWSAKTWEVYIHLMNCLLQSSLFVGLVLLFDFFSTWIYWYIS